MKYLRFNYQSASKDLQDRLVIACDEIIEKFFSESKNYLTKEAKSAVELDRAYYDAVSGTIKSFVTFKAKALLESFGKGSSMDVSSDYLFDYMESDLWNPMRTSIAIVGRPEGEYTDIFGNKRYSAGNFAGVPIENKVRPRKPSYSIQNAEKWLLEQNGMVERRITLEIEDFLSSIHKYFEYR